MRLVVPFWYYVLVVRQFEICTKRRRRSLIQAQGWSVATTLGHKSKKRKTLKALGLCDSNPFRVECMVDGLFPGLSLRSNPGLKLANAFGVFCSKSQTDALLKIGC